MEKLLKYLRIFFQSFLGRAVLSVVLFFSSIFSLFSSVPIATYYSENRSFKKLLLTILVSSLIIFIIGDTLFLLSYVLFIILITLLISYLSSKINDLYKLLIISVLISLSFYSLLFLGLFLFSGENSIYLFIKSVIEKTITFFNDSDFLNKIVKEAKMTEEEFLSYTIFKIPSLFVNFISIFVLINVMAISRYNQKLLSFLNINKLKKTKLPDIFSVFAVSLGALYVYSTNWSSNFDLKIISSFLLQSIGVIFFFYGMTIVYVFMFYKKSNSFLNTILFSLIVVFANVFVAFIGFFDLWFDFRKYLDKNRRNNESNT